MPRQLTALAAVLTVSTSAAVLADTYPRQPGIDAVHYTFRISLDDASDELRGEATVDLRFVEDGLPAFELDLASPADGTGMTVSAVSSADGALAFAHRDDRLRVTLASPSRAGNRRSFTIVYRGVPASGLWIGTNRYNERVFFSHSWPDKARQWLPVIDHPYDKSTSEFIVTAPDHYQVVSNGLLVETVDLADGRRRTHWRQSVPIASWLNALGVARFAVHHAGQVNGVPLESWVFHQDRDAGFTDFESDARHVLEFFGDRIGPFSYEKLANVQTAGIGGGMELASAIFYGETSITGEGRMTGLIAHEIAHQWFGDSVTESDWDDVWLSEGFATYFAQLFTEHARGRDAFVESLRQSRDFVLRFDAEHPGYRVIHDDLDDMSQVLSRQIYQKGGWTLHMLRGLIGTEAFWRGIQDYYRLYRNGNASTADFRRAMERAGGRDLQWFFDQWLRRGGVPQIEGTWQYDAGRGAVRIDLHQTQPGAPFRLPMEIGLSSEGQPMQRQRVEITERDQRLTIALAAPPTAVTLDPDTWVLMESALDPR